MKDKIRKKIFCTLKNYGRSKRIKKEEEDGNHWEFQINLNRAVYVHLFLCEMFSNILKAGSWKELALRHRV